MFMMVCVYIFNAIVNAVLFGIFVEQFQIIRKKDTEYQEKIDNSNSAMYDLNMPEVLQEDIRTYFQRINETKYQLKGQKGFFKNISPNLKDEVKAVIFRQALVDSSTFVALKLKFRRSH